MAFLKNKLEKLKIVSSIAAITFVLFSFSNDDEKLSQLLALLDKHANETPQEKIHIQFDKPYYSIGEDLWFKAYLVNANGNHLSSSSGVMYLNLIDEKDSVRRKIILPIKNGLANGSIYLSDSLLTAGQYHIIAYTKWMQNFSSNFFFHKMIPIVNALNSEVTGNLQYKSVMADNGKQLTTDITFIRDNGTTYSGLPVKYIVSAQGKTILNSNGITDLSGKLQIINNINKDYKDAVITIKTIATLQGGQTTSQDFVIKPLAASANVQFFPEGGQMINGIRTKVAFKAVKPDGAGENISGYVIDDTNMRVAELKSEHAGMGIFALSPQSGKIYTAVIKHADGSESRFFLPAAQNSGYVLNINHIGADSLSVRVSASAELANGAEMALIAQCNSIVQFVGKIKLDRPSNIFTLSTKKFPTGITQFTLFSPAYQPVAERLLFVNHSDELQADVIADKPAYNKREKTTLNLKVANPDGSPVVGSFSITVTDGTKVKPEEDNETTIFSNLLLTSDIKGYIEQPNYYFNPHNTERQKHLDQLLLTQGWRRFTWSDLQSGKFTPIKHEHESSINLSGNITTIGNKVVPGAKVNLLALSSGGSMILDTIADVNGHYIFDNLDISDSAKIVVKATNAQNNSMVKINVDEKPEPIFDKSISIFSNVTTKGLIEYMKYTKLQFDELNKVGLIAKGKVLKEVKIVSKRNYFAKTTVPNSANVAPGSADFILKEDKLKKETNLIYALYRIPGVVIYDNKACLFQSGYNIPMLVLVDGVVYPPSIVNELSVPDVEGVEILTSKTNLMMYKGAPGVILITMKKGGHMPTNNSFNVLHSTIRGYTPVKQFYSPAYDTPDQTKMADLRSTIYWNPDVVTGADGKASFSFYNADGTGSYKVTIEGMDTKGGLLRKTFTYVVK